ncbi:MAG: methyl-accepting chemotaxis protein [Defluviitaleaceae bacterium]|nr:methyl-accepting chemotaxis protein [Defluviitaleaceae bacterium]MCL2274298.1 methyl-accepting chemotaxis protein [Defluviitaleaceae bacterium]
MSFIKNLRIGAKLAVGFGMLLALVVVLSVYAVTSLTGTARNYQDLLDGPYARFILLEEVDMAITDMRHNVALIALHTGDAQGIDKFFAQMQAQRTTFDETTSAFLYNVDNDQNMSREMQVQRNAEIREIISMIDSYTAQHITPIVNAARAGNFQLAVQGVYNSLAADETIDTAFEKIFDSIVSVKEYEAERNSSETQTAALMLGGVAVVIFVLGIVVALVITRLITKPITNVVGAIKEVSQGNLNVNIRVESNDETGLLAQNALDLVDVIKSIVADLDNAYQEYMVVGDMRHSIPTGRYSNSFKEVIENVNTLLHRNTEDLNGLMDELTKVSEGDFTVKMDAAAWPGQWESMPNTVNALSANLHNVSQEINGMVVAASQKGNLAYHIDDTAYKNDWKKVMTGLNNIADAVNAPLVEIRDVMSKLGKGDFSTKVTGSYAGDFLAIKDAVNGMFDSLTGYMEEVSATLEAVAQGDLTRRINREYLGDFTRLKDSLNNISSTLHKTMSEISSASEQVLTGAKQISTSAIDLANGAQQQASSIEELNASIDIINQQTQKNAASADEASSLSHKSSENANAGSASMGQMLNAMSEIKDSSNEISKIIQSIQDISFQTNLLSLNASVEAARAGEHGRGFAVVADEVRNLANKSQKSATESTELINHSNARVDAGGEIANETSASLAVIVQNATEVLKIIDEISGSSKEQADSIQQVSIGLAQISSVVQSNSAVSEETAAASEELNSQAEVMRQLVGYFKL